MSDCVSISPSTHCVDLTVDLSRKWSNNEKSTRTKWMFRIGIGTHCTNLSLRVYVWKCLSAKSEAINLNFHCEFLFFFLLLLDVGERLNIYNRTQSFDYILCENRKEKSAPCAFQRRGSHLMCVHVRVLVQHILLLLLLLLYALWQWQQ